MNEESCFVRIGDASKQLGVSHSTLRRWTDNGTIAFTRLPSGHRIIDISRFSKKEQKTFEKNQVIFYSRVSSHKQKDDLERQKEYIEKKYFETNRKEEFKHVFDIASGLNFKRRGLIGILDAVKKGEVQQVVVASKDRLARFGYDLIEWICSEYGTKILVLDDENSTPTEELGKDLLSIIQVYCCKWNGSRRYKKYNKIEEDIKTKIISNEGTKRDIK
jgi:excisionase family DNA binding protein